MKRYLFFFIVLLSFCFNWNRVEAKSKTSREEKGCTGLDHNRFRYYDSNSGTYISKDPIGLAGNNPNLYAYTHDSNSWVDPFGLNKCGGKFKEINKQALPDWIVESFEGGNYKTVMTQEDIIVYRVFGGKASMTSGNVETHIGKEGILYEKGKITGDIAYAEAKLLTGGAEKKIGFQVEASADAGAAKADFEGQNDFFGIIKTKAKIGLSGGSGAIGGKAGAYLDYDDYEIGVNVGGKIAALLGIEGDVEISISAKPIVETFKNIKEYFSPSIVEGTIITGDSTVIIG